MGRKTAGLCLLVLSAGCGDVFTESADRSLEATVALEGADRLRIDAPVDLVVDGSRDRSNLFIQLEATVTASSATTAERLASALELRAETFDGGEGIEVRVAGVDTSISEIEGTLTVETPPDVDLRAIGRGGTVDIIDIEGVIESESVSHTRVEGAESNCSVIAQRGNALVETSAPPGSDTIIRTGSGDAQITLPAALSVDITAEAGRGQVVVRHPRLPPPRDTSSYAVRVRSGAAVVQISTNVGNILIQ